MKYAFIERHRRVWPISVQCHVLGVSVAGYHEHFVRRASGDQRRPYQAFKKLMAAISEKDSATIH